MNYPLLIVPGWQDSDEHHWQTIWEKKLKAKRVIQDEWMHPIRSKWITRLKSVVDQQVTPPVLICHSLGCNTAVALSSETDCRVAGLFLVAPADLEMKETPAEITGFLPTSEKKLRFPSLLIASQNDPYCSIQKNMKFADMWGSKLVDIGPKGHINVATGFGEWDEGLILLQNFINSL